MLPPSSAKELLLPKSLRLDSSLHAEVHDMWQQCCSRSIGFTQRTRGNTSLQLCSRPIPITASLARSFVRVPEEHFHYFCASAGLQMKTGLVGQDVFFRALRILTEEHRATLAPTTAQASTHRADDQSTPMFDTRSASGSSFPASTDANVDRHLTTDTAPSLQNFFDRVIACFPDSACQAELRRYFALDETRVVLQFRKTELLKMLCAAFPLDPVRAFGAPGNTLPLEDLYQLAPPFRSFAGRASDRDVFWWSVLENGMPPYTGFSDRLARIDACEEADCRLPPLSPASDDRSDDDDASGPPSSTTPHTPSQPNASSDHASRSTSSSPTPKAANDDSPTLLESLRTRDYGALQPAEVVDACSRSSSASFSSDKSVVDPATKVLKGTAWIDGERV